METEFFKFEETSEDIDICEEIRQVVEDSGIDKYSFYEFVLSLQRHKTITNNGVVTIILDNDIKEIVNEWESNQRK